MKDITTIKLKQETKARLSRLKESERESFEEVIRKVLFILNRVRKDPISANRLLGRIDKNIQRKNQYTHHNEETKKIPKKQTENKKQKQESKKPKQGIPEIKLKKKQEK